VWLCQYLNRTDTRIAHESPNLMETLESLRTQHAPEDHNSVMSLYKKLFALKLGPREEPVALINRAQDIATQLKNLKEDIRESQISSAVVAALEASPLYESTIKTMQTMGGIITINRLINAFQNTGVPKIAGALHVEHDNNVPPPQQSYLEESIANLSKVANQIKNHVHKRFAPYFKKNHHGRGGQDAQQQDAQQGRGQGGGYRGNRGGYQNNRGGYNPRGGYHGGQQQQQQQQGNRGGYQGNRGGPRGRGRVSFSRGGGRQGPIRCYNCGKANHTSDECFLPCGACGNRYHKFYDCHLNPMSNNYTGNNGQYSRANQAIDTSTLGEDIPQANFGHAFNAYHPLPEDLAWNGPPGYEPGQVQEPADPDTHFYNIGVASSVSVLKKSPEALVSHTWYMDGGASHHFTPHRYMLHDYTPDIATSPVYVRVATHHWTRRAGVGTIKVETQVNGKSYFKAIKNVWHVPEFAHSLLSVNMLKASGCWGIIGRKGQTATMDDFYFDEGNNLWLVAKFQKGLNVPDWKLYLPTQLKDLSSIPDTSNSNTPSAHYARPNHATDKETPQLWHQRLGHVDMRSLQYLVANKKVTGVKIPVHTIRKHQHGPACKICVMSRHNRSPFHERREKAPEILHTVHTDVCGPYSVPSLGGGAYVVTLVDEFSGKADVSVVKKKDIVPDELRRMILTWENLTGKKVKFLFSDRGGEYINHVLANWCASKGIKHVYSVPRTPEQNGIAERLNQTLNNIVRALLFQYKLYMPLWGHAITYACMLYNVRMHKHLKITHEEAFSGKVPDLSNFRTFGCLVYARVADSARKKLDPKSQQGIFLGPETDGPGYKVLTYNEKLKRDKYQVRIFRDIVTFEALKSVCGVQDESQLFWGGGIDLPEPLEVEDDPPELESLTGVPEQPAIQAAPMQLVVPPQLLGAGERVAQDSQVPAQDSEVPRSEGHMQLIREQLVRVAPTPQPGTSSLPMLEGPSPGPMQPQQLGSGVQQQQRSGSHDRGTTQLVGVPSPQLRSGMQQDRARVSGSTPQVAPHPSNTHVTQPNPMQAMHSPPLPQKPRVIPTGTQIARSPHPISRLINPPHSTQPIQPTTSHRYSLRPRGTRPATPAPKPTTQVGIKRAAPALQAQAFKWSPLHVPPGHSVVMPTAFSAFSPYPQPNVAKHEIPLPSKAEMVHELLRYFNVNEPTDGPLPVITEAYKEDVPSTLKQAMATKYARFWAEATVEEWLSLMGNNTWVLIDREPWMKVIPSKWIYTIKTNQNGIPIRFKARLVAGGHRQTEGIDYDETYAPVSRLATLRTMLAVAARRNWKVHQIDIKTAFLNGEIDKDVYMQQAPGFVDGDGKVVKLGKSIYGLKQAPRIWYLTLCEALRDLGLKPISADSSFWVKEDGDTLVYMTSVVDDILITSENESETIKIKEGILDRFEGTNMGEAVHYNGMKITWLREEGVVILSQPAHIQKMLDIFGQIENLNEFKTLPAPEGLRLHKKGSTACKEDSPLLDVTKYPYRQAMGTLNYIACTVRPDIVWLVNQLSRYSNAPTVEHWRIAMNLMKYLKYTINWGICLGHGSGMGNVLIKQTPPISDADVVAYSDANFGTGIDDKRSVTGYVLQVFGGPVSWASKTQTVTSLSTTESEFRALSTASREALWLTKILTLFKIPTMPFLIRGDSKSAIESIKSYNYTKNNKHVQIRHDFMRDYYMRGELSYEHIEGKYNPADIFTKALGQIKFEAFRAKLGMRPVPEGH
jgi:hypothetical protein